ncbi:MAG: ribonuclease III [Spirochaetes bacterium]|nr:ribonuclease III [Spirochaetota bacterium]
MFDQKDIKIKNLLKKFNLNCEIFEKYKEAFIHRSYLQIDKNVIHNERLEFLGDAVLELIITDYLYDNFNLSENILTLIRSKIVCENSLSLVSKKLKLGDIIYLGKGEELNGGRNKSSILADTFEALIGAIYKFESYEKAKEFVLKNLENNINKVVKEKSFLHAKTHLQEISQHLYKKLPQYIILEEKKNNSSYRYKILLKVGEMEVGPVISDSKRKAENELAIMAINKLREDHYI